ncbi:uncharacterized protein LOC129229120 [Uloborus diversus]|uniref:uncharacterized protein LOC129229120 n=1 Tax=Uloborus diversus TaxID=327109 RepID=UPI002409786B|nr:uncharacterized protein LOC129229120 [Uloborus diversus]
MTKIIDSLECGKCGEVFHQLEIFIKHKMSGCTPKEDESDEDAASKEAKNIKQIVKKPTVSEASPKTSTSKYAKEIDKMKKSCSPQVLKKKFPVSPSSSSKKSKLLPDAPKLKGVTGYLWKKRMMQEQLKDQKRLMIAKRKAMQYASDEGSFEQDESSESDDMIEMRPEAQCGNCAGCLREEDCLECEVCLRKMEDPDLEDLCILRECTEADNEVFKVEKILAKRFRHGRYEYLIKWKGYPNSQNTWEPKENILSPTLLEEFEKRHHRLIAKRSQLMPAPKKRKKFYYTESSDDSSQDEMRASRMFSPATALDAQRGRSSKKAAMNFIKTVCLKGRRPSPEVVHFDESVVSSDSDARSRSPSPPPEMARKKIIIEVPDPSEEGKFVRIKGEARRIKFLKDCDLNPVVALGQRVPMDEAGIQAYLFDYLIQARLKKLNTKKSFRNIEIQSGSLSSPKLAKDNSNPVKFIPSIKSASIAKLPIPQLSKSIDDKIQDKKRRVTYQEKIESLLSQERNDMEVSFDDVDDSLNGGDSKTLAELRESLRQNMKKTEEKKTFKPSGPESVPKVGARKNFVRPIKSKPSPAQSSLHQAPTTSSTNSAKDSTINSGERVFVVMPDGSMVEVSSAKSDENVSKSSPEPVKKTPAKEKPKVPKPLAVASKKPVTQVSLEDCTSDATDDSRTLKLPNTLQLVQSELPLSEAENSNKLIGMFLFRQVISPNDTNHKCLLCTAKNTYRTLLDLEKHYSTVHELASQMFKAEFSENIVFVCVPPDVTEQTTLNSVCRFCDITLKNLAEVRSHYPTSHTKVVRLVHEQQVMELNTSLFCSICSKMSKNFTDHHSHMKSVHRMQTYVCKYCSFITSRANRLKSHVKQKHPQVSSPLSNTVGSVKGNKLKQKCPVCQLFINGKETLDQHVTSSHAIQTGPEIYSCIKCLRHFGSLKEFTDHVFNCTPTDVEEPVKLSQLKQDVFIYKCNQCASMFFTERDIKKHLADSKHAQSFEVVAPNEVGNYNCFLCDKIFATDDLCRSHYLHVHMAWIEKSAPKFVETHGDVEKDDIDGSITANNAPGNEELAVIEFPDKIGHYCHHCDYVIKNYTLFCLHMQGMHACEKRFQCAITSCTKTFTSPSEFKKHSRVHDQRYAHNCSICDSTFTDEAELKEHNLSVEHGTKYMKMHEKCRPSGIEARNHQCKVCQTWFGLHHYLVRHMETDDHDYTCQKCGLQYLQPGSRRLHIQQVHPEIATTCEFCTLKMSSTQAVWGHLKTHGIVHECEICHRRFLHKEQVTTHMEAHDPPVQCPWEGCFRQLVTKISLYYHLKTHRGDIDYKCSVCSKGFMKQKLLEAHMRTHQIETPAPKPDEKAEEKAQSEGELIQLICAGCEKGFDDEDQFAGHECSPEKESVIPASVAETEQKVDSVQSESVSKEKVSGRKLSEDNKDAEDSSKTKSADVLLDAVLEDSADSHNMQDSNFKQATDEKSVDPDEEPKTLEIVSTENSVDVPDKNFNVESAASNIEDEKKEFIDGVLSISNQESNDGSSAQFDDISSEMVLAMEKNQVMNLEDSNSISNQPEFSLDGESKLEETVEVSSEQPMDISESENKIDSEKFIEADSQAQFSDAVDSEQQIISEFASISQDITSVSEKENLEDTPMESSDQILEASDGSQEIDSEHVVMMVADHQDDSQSIELELPDDSQYNRTYMKVPTSDGKMLLIPFSATESGTTVLSLPPGLTLEHDGTAHGQTIQVALEGAEEVDENGEPTGQRFLHVPVEGEVMEELLQSGGIQVEEKMTTDTIVTEADISLQCSED